MSRRSRVREELSADVRRRLLLIIERLRKDGLGAIAALKEEDATAKLLVGVRRSLELSSGDGADVGEGGSMVLGLV